MMNDFHITVKTQSMGLPVCCPEDLNYAFSRQYERDSFFYKESESFLLFMGLCYNKEEVVTASGKNWAETMFRYFESDSVRILRQLDGSFSGIFYDAKKRDLLLFSDHLSTIPVYYYRDRNIFAADTDLFRLAGEIRKRGIPISLSEFGAYSMLAYSFMLDNYTLLSDVYKVRPASFYSYRLNRTERYFDYYTEDKDFSASANAIAEGIDVLFSQAVKERLSTDRSSSHIFTLSGGLDSRLYLFYALRYGYQNIVTVNYSQTFYREETIAKKIAADCHCEHIFFSLDHGNYLAEIDEGIRATYGMTTYRPILPARMVWKNLNMKNHTVVHTGLLGDAVLGGYCIDKCNGDDRFHSPADLAMQLNPKNKSILSAPYRNELIPLFDRILDWIPDSKLTSLPSEKFVLDNRYINGLMQSALGTRDIAAVSSPYVSKKLMKYVFSFPSSVRLNHSLYFTWMNTYMPSAARYIWENTGLKPMYGKVAVKPHAKVVTWLKQLEAMVGPQKPENSRNPYQYWMKHNANIQKGLYEYCSQKLFLLDSYPELKEISMRILKYHNIYLLIRLATLLGFWRICLFDGKGGD